MRAPYTFLQLIRVLDDDGSISFTSLYLYAGLFLMVLQPVVPETAAILTLIFANTQLKKVFRHKQQLLADKTAITLAETDSAKDAAALQPSDDLNKLKQQVQTLTQIVNLRN